MDTTNMVVVVKDIRTCWQKRPTRRGNISKCVSDSLFWEILWTNYSLTDTDKKIVINWLMCFTGNLFIKNVLRKTPERSFNFQSQHVPTHLWRLIRHLKYSNHACSSVSSGGRESSETKETSDSQVPQGSGLLSKTLTAIQSRRTRWRTLWKVLSWYSISVSLMKCYKRVGYLS